MLSPSRRIDQAKWILIQVTQLKTTFELGQFDFLLYVTQGVVIVCYCDRLRLR